MYKLVGPHHSADASLDRRDYPRTKPHPNRTRAHAGESRESPAVGETYASRFTNDAN